jgi:uncharacterized protein YndB with AHSA1/START domain
MMVSDDAARGQTQALSLDFDLAHPPEKVWRALTDPALLAQWLLPVIGLELAPGAAFTLRTQPHPGWDGTVDCRFITIEPYRTLSYTWRVPFLDTVVTFTLTPNESGTRLCVVQSGFTADQQREFGGARYGWTMMGGKLADLLARIA